MYLTRRDALIAVAAGAFFGGTSLTVGSNPLSGQGKAANELSSSDVATLVAVAEVVYPSEVQNAAEFVNTYANRLPTRRQREMSETISGLNVYSNQHSGAHLPSLEPDHREVILREMGVDKLGSNPEGYLPERVRYYLVDQLLFGLFSSPKGSRLVGVENPVGYPGGIVSYQRRPRVREIGRDRSTEGDAG